MSDRPELPDGFVALVDQAHRVNEADRTAFLARMGETGRALADQLTEALLPSGAREAGLRLVWTVPVGTVLTSADPEPPPGTVVRDDCGQKWQRYREGAVAWEPWEGGNSESWMKIAGNYGPVTVIRWGSDDG